MTTTKDTAPGRLLLDTEFGRYDVFALARKWMEVLRTMESTRGLGSSEVIKMAIDDVISGRVTEDDIEKALKKKQATAEESTDEKKADKPAEKE